MIKLTETELLTEIGISTLRELLNELKPSDKYQFIDVKGEYYLLYKYNGVKLSEIALFDTKKELENYVLTKAKKL